MDRPFSIGLDALDQPYPGHLIVDKDQRILRHGPLIARLCPTLRIGDAIHDHFTWLSPPHCGNLPQLASQPRTVVQLRCDSSASAVFTGCLVADGDRYLLALQVAPASLSAVEMDWRISDFAPGDPQVDLLLLVAMQKAMLQEANELAEKLADERQKAEALRDRLARLSSYLAHDFNNHLSILRLNVGRINWAVGDNPRARRVTQIVAETIDRASEVARSWIALSRDDREPAQIVRLDELIAEHMPYFRALAGKRIAVEADLRAAGVLLFVAPSRLVNCLTNFVINACDATASSGRIAIATRIAGDDPDQAGPQVCITVQDTGSGMTAEQLSRAFNPYFTTKMKGSGIGLASVREFAVDAGGQAWLESRPGDGTTAFLRLPVTGTAGTAGREETDNRSSLPIAAPAVKRVHRARVLVVEDEQYALEALVELLEADGFQVSPASSLADARASLQSASGAGAVPDILLSDLLLPDGRGSTVAREAQALFPAVRVVMMSGEGFADNCSANGWAWIAKPIDSRVLTATLHGVLASRTSPSVEAKRASPSVG